MDILTGKRAYGNMRSFLWRFITDAKNTGYFMEGDSSVGRALLDCRGHGSESHSLSFFYSRIECWREKRIVLYGRMSSEERKEK